MYLKRSVVNEQYPGRSNGVMSMRATELISDSIAAPRKIAGSRSRNGHSSFVATKMLRHSDITAMLVSNFH